MEEGDPALAAREFLRLGNEQGPLRLAGDDAAEPGLLAAGGDHQRDARTDDDLRGLQLGSHAADGRLAARAAGYFLQGGVHLLHHVDRFRGRFSEVFDEAVDGRQDDEQVGRKQRGDEGGELVVVAELDLGEGDRVVLVDDGDDAVGQQRDEGVAGVQMPVVVLEVVVREQHLGDGQLVFREELFVGGHQPRLADGGARLEFGELLGALGVAEDAHAGPDRAGGNEDDLAAGFPLGGHLRHQLFHLGQIRLLLGIRQHAGAQLDDKTADVLQHFGSHAGVRNTGFRQGGSFKRGFPHGPPPPHRPDCAPVAHPSTFA